MVKVYFGPYQKSPVPELPADERFLWLRDMHMLKGFERDFWTSNPLHLDQFDPSQIMLWCGTSWQPMAEVAGELGLLDAIERMPSGQTAIMCELATEARAVGLQAQQP